MDSCAGKHTEIDISHSDKLRYFRIEKDGDHSPEGDGADGVGSFLFFGFNKRRCHSNGRTPADSCPHRKKQRKRSRELECFAQKIYDKKTDEHSRQDNDQHFYALRTNILEIERGADEHDSQDENFLKRLDARMTELGHETDVSEKYAEQHSESGSLDRIFPTDNNQLGKQGGCNSDDKHHRPARQELFSYHMILLCLNTLSFFQLKENSPDFIGRDQECQGRRREKREVEKRGKFRGRPILSLQKLFLDKMGRQVYYQEAIMKWIFIIC